MAAVGKPLLDIEVDEGDNEDDQEAAASSSSPSSTEPEAPTPPSSSASANTNSQQSDKHSSTKVRGLNTFHIAGIAPISRFPPPHTHTHTHFPTSFKHLLRFLWAQPNTTEDVALGFSSSFSQYLTSASGCNIIRGCNANCSPPPALPLYPTGFRL